MSVRPHVKKVLQNLKEPQTWAYIFPLSNESRMRVLTWLHQQMDIVIKNWSLFSHQERQEAKSVMEDILFMVMDTTNPHSLFGMHTNHFTFEPMSNLVLANMQLFKQKCAKL